MARRAGDTAAGDERGEGDGEPESGAALADFAAVLRYLRGLADPCAPPVGVGAFDVLCASERHILVWYTPAREGHEAREYAIPTGALAAAWTALCAGTALNEAALVSIGGSAAVGRWLLALLAQLPGVEIVGDRGAGGEEMPLTLSRLAGAPLAEPAAEVPRTLPHS